MHTILIYDISDDRARSKVADACLDYGLDRVQYSAFYGKLSYTHQEELMLRILDVLDDKHGNIHIYPIAQREWDKRMLWGDD